jgi:hypothetical protein
MPPDGLTAVRWRQLQRFSRGRSPALARRWAIGCSLLRLTTAPGRRHKVIASDELLHRGGGSVVHSDHTIGPRPLPSRNSRRGRDNGHPLSTARVVQLRPNRRQECQRYLVEMIFYDRQRFQAVATSCGNSARDHPALVHVGGRLWLDTWRHSLVTRGSLRSHRPRSARNKDWPFDLLRVRRASAVSQYRYIGRRHHTQV